MKAQSKLVMAQLSTFRNAFHLPCRNKINWYPGHMTKGMRQIRQKLRNIDCIVEVHDARIPIAGRNSDFFDSVTGNGIKPHILVLNKSDLAGPNPKQQNNIIRQLREQEPQLKNVLFTNCKDQRNSGIMDILPLATKLVAESSRYHRTNSAEHNIMIIGVPNVGKSSIINVLRNVNLKKRSAACVGALAGVTRAFGERIKIQEHPPVYMIDTPGILEPSISDDEMGMKLALVGCLPDHIVGEELIADYLLYWLNKHKRFKYAEKLGLSCGPCDSICTVLADYAQQHRMFHRVKKYDGQVESMTNLLAAARQFISLFRTGKLGAINLDEEYT